jgi:hypothetical protein
MTDQPSQSFIDAGNPYLRPDYPSSLAAGVIAVGATPYAALCWRVANTTLTVIADRAYLESIIADLQKIRDALPTPSGLLLPPGLNGVKP